MITMQRQIEIVQEMFDKFVEPVASSFMCGQVPSTMFAIHRHGTKERDWLAMIRFKNTLTISVFRCEVWLEDIVRLCRRCKIWLLTDDIYQVISLYFMLNPLYQTQYMDFSHEIESDYESMISEAGKAAYRFIKEQFTFTTPVQRTVLEMLNYHNMIFTNHFYGPRKEDVGDAMEEARLTYKGYMMNKHPMAYKSAIHFKASAALVDEGGFVHLEHTGEVRKGITYVRHDIMDLEEAKKQSLDDIKPTSKHDYRNKSFSVQVRKQVSSKGVKVRVTGTGTPSNMHLRKR